jgi:hypothetical protein
MDSSRSTAVASQMVTAASPPRPLVAWGGSITLLLFGLSGRMAEVGSTAVGTRFPYRSYLISIISLAYDLDLLALRRSRRLGRLCWIQPRNLEGCKNVSPVSYVVRTSLISALTSNQEGYLMSTTYR